MSVRIRLRRLGAKKRPFYRVVVADQRSPRDGKFIEIIGKYHPLEDPSLIEIDEDRALDWLQKGAQPSEAVTNLLRKVGIWERFKGTSPEETVKSTTPSTVTTSTVTTSTVTPSTTTPSTPAPEEAAEAEETAGT